VLASEASVQARLVASVPLLYPPGARSDELEGDVSLEIVLDTDGTVTDARVLRAAGHGFDESALRAVRRYRFTSAQRHGRPVRVRMPWTVQFRIR
jgi:TonB family protein